MDEPLRKVAVDVQKHLAELEEESFVDVATKRKLKKGKGATVTVVVVQDERKFRESLPFFYFLEDQVRIIND